MALEPTNASTMTIPGVWIWIAVTGICVFGVFAVVAGAVVILRSRRKRFQDEEERRRKLRLKHRNSLEKYPSFIAERVDGLITLLSLEEEQKLENGAGENEKGKQWTDLQHCVVVIPRKTLRDWKGELDMARLLRADSRCH